MHGGIVPDSGRFYRFYPSMVHWLRSSYASKSRPTATNGRQMRYSGDSHRRIVKHEADGRAGTTLMDGEFDYSRVLPNLVVAAIRLRDVSCKDMLLPRCCRDIPRIYHGEAPRVPFGNWSRWRFFPLHHIKTNKRHACVDPRFLQIRLGP